MQRTDLGPCTSQKCVKESCCKSVRSHGVHADVTELTMKSIETCVSEEVQSDIVADMLAPCVMSNLINPTVNTDHLHSRMSAGARSWIRR